MTALDEAKKKGHTAVVRLLESAPNPSPAPAPAPNPSPAPKPISSVAAAAVATSTSSTSSSSSTSASSNGSKKADLRDVIRDFINCPMFRVRVRVRLG